MLFVGWRCNLSTYTFDVILCCEYYSVRGLMHALFYILFNLLELCI